MSEQPEQGRERPARYDRTFSGLIAAMIATVVFVGGYVAFRAVTREAPDLEPESVNYLACVADLQAADTPVTFPRALPAGWIDTSIDFERGTPPQWRVGILTDRGEFVGVVQQGTDVDDLLDEYVDENPQQGDDAAPDNSLGATTWQTWSDAGGDHAFSTTLTSGPLAGQNLLVYGSAPVADQEALISLLTLDPAEVPEGERCAAPGR